MEFVGKGQPLTRAGLSKALERLGLGPNDTAYVWTVVEVETACNIEAATAAACGTAADVPKKFGKPSGSTSRPKNVVLAPSGATISGFRRICGIAKRLPAVSKIIGVDPAEENRSKSGRETPNSGVLR